VNALPTWVVGAPIAAVIAILALRFRSLTLSGAMTAFLCGTVAMAAGWSWGIYLVCYFVAASALSRYRAGDKTSRSEGRVAREGARSAVQVAANGGVFVLSAVAFLVEPTQLAMAAGVGALAASAGDTWATELGSLSARPPRSILSLRPVPIGTSGGVSWRGLAASVMAGLFSAAIVWAIRWPGALAASALAGAMIGSVVDSILGATLQCRRWCDSCDQPTERSVHSCGAPTRHVGGVRWLNNDAVNFAATIAGAVVGGMAVQ
jgi:uncharacterized protein (TIGR00297 family)